MGQSIRSSSTSRFGLDVRIKCYISCPAVTHYFINISFENRGFHPLRCPLLRLVLLVR